MWRELNEPEWDVTVITKSNIDEYAPEFKQVVADRRLSLAKRSDVLRLLLLKRHGGVWADASVYPTAPLSEFIDLLVNETKFFAYRFLVRRHAASGSRDICSWFLAADQVNHPLISKWSDRFFARIRDRECRQYYCLHDTLAGLIDEDQEVAACIHGMVQVSSAIPHSASRGRVRLDSYMYKRPRLRQTIPLTEKEVDGDIAHQNYGHSLQEIGPMSSSVSVRQPLKRKIHERHASGYDFLFLVCVGRSGSTLVSGLLNAIPGVTVRGENNFYAYHLFKSHACLLKSRRRWGRGRRGVTRASSAWFGANLLRPSMFAKRAGEIVREQIAADDRSSTVGFKEIRWQLLQLEEVDDFVSFAEAALGRVGWILHTRPLEEVRESGRWRTSPPEDCEAAFRHTSLVQSALRERVPSRCFDSSLPRIKSDFDGWATDLLQWGGWPVRKKTLGMMRTVSKIRHSSRTRRPKSSSP
jgi:hypothetical protein